MSTARLCAWLCIVGALLIAALSLWAEYARSETVHVLARLHDNDTRDVFLAMPEDAMPSAERYGVVEGLGPVECIVFNRDRLIVPKSADGPPLLFVDRAAGEGLLLRRALRGRCFLALSLVILCGFSCSHISRRQPEEDSFCGD